MENFGDKFWYIVYFQQLGVAEAQFEADLRKSLRMIYFAGSGDAPEGLWTLPKPASAKFLDGLIDPPSLPARRRGSRLLRGSVPTERLPRTIEVVSEY
jgi:hypothetical protein